MKASEYIARLQQLIAEHGDLDMVYICDDCYYDSDTDQLEGPCYVNKENCQDFSFHFDGEEAFSMERKWTWLNSDWNN